MPSRPKPSVVVFAKDIVGLAKFYMQVAGLQELQRDGGHVVLDGESFQVVIHGIPKMIAAEIEITQPPAIREDNPIKLCLPVESIEQSRKLAAEFGGKIGSKSKEWEARGFRACDGYDPEGNVFQVRETATSAET